MSFCNVNNMSAGDMSSAVSSNNHAKANTLFGTAESRVQIGRVSELF